MIVKAGGIRVCLPQFPPPFQATISYLFDGNENRRHTCQWRVVGPNPQAIRTVVQQLTEALEQIGVTFDPPRLSNTACYFQDHGPLAR